MATGTGKTLVMAMLIAWSSLNKAANPQVAAVNGDGRWGTWSYAVVRAKAEVRIAIEAVLTVTPSS
jgi:hypothetical protein